MIIENIKNITQPEDLPELKLILLADGNNFSIKDNDKEYATGQLLGGEYTEGYFRRSAENGVTKNLGWFEYQGEETTALLMYEIRYDPQKIKATGSIYPLKCLKEMINTDEDYLQFLYPNWSRRMKKDLVVEKETESQSEA